MPGRWICSSLHFGVPGWLCICVSSNWRLHLSSFRRRNMESRNMGFKWSKSELPWLFSDLTVIHCQNTISTAYESGDQETKSWSIFNVWWLILFETGMFTIIPKWIGPCFLDVIASLDCIGGMRVRQWSLSHSKMLSHLLDIWSYFLSQFTQFMYKIGFEKQI